MRPLDRRGISPLIATVLLMAFAVALGGMIMNWQGDLQLLDCGEVALDVERFCYDQQHIRVTARNTGEKALAAVLLRIDSPEAGQFEIAAPNSAMSVGASIDSRIPFLVDEETGVELYAQVENAGEAATCGEPVAARRPLPKC